MRPTLRFLSSVAVLLVVGIPHHAGAQSNSTKAASKPIASTTTQAPTPAASTPAGTTPAPQTSAPAQAAPSSPSTTPSATTGQPSPAPQAGPGTAAAGLELEPRGYTYDPAGRRDPFVSLLRRGSDVQSPAPGSRVGGLAGLETSEVTLKGTFASRGEVVGIVLGVDNRTYIVKPGDRLLDGTVHTISPDSMVITQQVTDPLSLEKQREVRKLLRQTEEAK